MVASMVGLPQGSRLGVAGRQAAVATPVLRYRERTQIFRKSLYPTSNECDRLRLSGYRPASRVRADKPCVTASAIVAASSAPKPVAKEFKWGADMKSLSICLAIGAVTWFAPSPAGSLLWA